MRSEVRWATIIAMTEAHPDRVAIEFDPDRITIEFESGDPIQGRLIDAAGAMRPFRGWLELCAELERAWSGFKRDRAHDAS